VTFTVGTIGTEPLSYQWQWKPAGENGSSEEWQLCDMEGAVLSIPSVQKSSEGQYRCNISNCAGSQTSNTAALSLGKKLIDVHYFYVHHHLMPCFYSIAEAPRITIHPQELKDVVPGHSVTLTIQATGTQPLMYQWQWTRTGDGKGEEGGSEEWQLCDVEGPQTAVLSIPSVQKSNEGQYRCNISNCAGSQTSNTATLSLGKRLNNLQCKVTRCMNRRMANLHCPYH